MLKKKVLFQLLKETDILEKQTEGVAAFAGYLKYKC